MAKILAGRNPIADQLLQFLDIGKAAPFGTRPDQPIVNVHLENAPHARPEGNFPDLEGKGR